MVLIQAVALILSFSLVMLNSNIPVIGIISNPHPYDAIDITSTTVNAYYVQWLEAAGARSLAIHPWTSDSELDILLTKVNGLLWQGGGRNMILDHSFEKFGLRLIMKLMALKDKKNISIPLWVTCWGFEFLQSALAGTTHIKSKFDAYNIATPLIFNQTEIKQSKVFADFDANDFENLRIYNTTMHFHHFGITVSNFKKYGLDKLFKVTSLGEGLDKGNISIESIEGIKYPIYGTQFHPEKIPFDRYSGHQIPQSTKAIRVSMNLATFFVDEARKNGNNFSESEMTNYDFIDPLKNKPQDVGKGVFNYVYKKPQHYFEYLNLRLKIK